jgi:cytoskeletal protein RodZ
MLSVGETLQRARLDQGLDVAAVAERTKINVRHLEAIEADDRKSLPSSFFYKSFVQQYAKFLSLDTKEIDAEIDRVLSAEAPLPLPGQDNQTWREIPPVQLPGRYRRKRTYASLAALILMLGACSGIYAWWRQGRLATMFKAAPSIPVGERVQPREAATVPPVPVSLASDQSSAAAQQATLRSPTPGNKVLLDLIAHEETWLSVSSDGKQVFAGILAPNQSKTVEGKEYAKMRVGNAAGIEVRLNGKLLGPLGHRGQVLIVVFRPDRFEIVPPAKESD